MSQKRMEELMAEIEKLDITENQYDEIPLNDYIKPENTNSATPT